MPREIFGHVTDPPESLGSRKWYTVPLSLAAHVAAIIPIVLVPLLATEVLPLPRDYNVFVVAPPTPPEPPAPPRPVTQKPPQANPNAAPTEAPDKITPESIPVAPPPEIGGGIDPGGIPGGSPIITAEPPPPPLPAVVQKPVPVGGVIRRPEKIRDVPLVYPPIALAAGIQGMVILEAIIGIDGKIQNLRVLRSAPLLDQAALDAVRQWEYSPTTLNGVPVPVVMSVTVVFSLNRK